jgi:hypothetical protein
MQTFKYLVPPKTKDERADKYQMRCADTLAISGIVTPTSVILSSTRLYNDRLTGKLESVPQYHIMPSWEYAVNVILSSPAPTFFCMVKDATPLSLYLDFDGKKPEAFADRAEFHTTVQLCVDYLRVFLNLLFNTRLCPEYYDGVFRFYDASVPGAKWSMHAHARLTFASVAVLKDVMHKFAALLRSTLQLYDARLQKLFYNGDEILDLSPYRAGAFRLPLNRKRPDWTNALLPLVPLSSQAEELFIGMVHLCVNEKMLNTPTNRLAGSELRPVLERNAIFSQEYAAIKLYSSRVKFVLKKLGLSLDVDETNDSLCLADFGEIEAFILLTRPSMSSVPGFDLFSRTRGDLSRYCLVSIEQIGMSRFLACDLD